MDGEAAPQAAGIASLLDWGELARLTDPVTLELVAEAYKDWRVGYDGEWLWAVRAVLDDAPGPHSPLCTVIIARTPIGLAEQLYVQERLRALPADTFALMHRVCEVTGG